MWFVRSRHRAGWPPRHHTATISPDQQLFQLNYEDDERERAGAEADGAGDDSWPGAGVPTTALAAKKLNIKEEAIVASAEVGGAREEPVHRAAEGAKEDGEDCGRTHLERGYRSPS